MSECTECDDPECPGIVTCPKCGATEHGEAAHTHLIDHNMCHDCLEDWKFSLNQYCYECDEPFDDNPGKHICKTCEDWAVT
jgi:hypothetical protein